MPAMRRKRASGGGASNSVPHGSGQSSADARLEYVVRLACYRVLHRDIARLPNSVRLVLTDELVPVWDWVRAAEPDTVQTTAVAIALFEHAQMLLDDIDGALGVVA